MCRQSGSSRQGILEKPDFSKTRHFLTGVSREAGFPIRIIHLTYPPYPSHSFVLIFGLYPCISVVSCIPCARVPTPRIHFLATHRCVRLRLSHVFATVRER
jgi:hypothetical protein